MLVRKLSKEFHLLDFQQKIRDIYGDIDISKYRVNLDYSNASQSNFSSVQIFTKDVKNMLNNKFMKGENGLHDIRKKSYISKHRILVLFNSKDIYSSWRSNYQVEIDYFRGFT